MPVARSFDYVLLGAGSADYVLANRLTADPRVSVCLIEAGGSHGDCERHEGDG